MFRKVSFEWSFLNFPRSFFKRKMYVKSVNTRVRLWLYYYGHIVFPRDSENNSSTN